jgi:4-alpha-glucanotransferase
MTTELDRLGTLAGIEPAWFDIFGNRTTVPATTMRALLAAMGLPAHDDAAVAASLDLLEGRAWVRAVDATTVVDDSGPVAVVLCVPDGSDGIWTIVEETGAVHSGSFSAAALPLVERRAIGGVTRVRCRLDLPVMLAQGYHTVTVETAAERAQGVLIVAPARCLLPQEIDPDRRFWGVAAQLYGLRSQRNWGMGDFTDLAEFAERVAAEGGSLVGLNPLHALFPAEPGHISPYSPSTRAFLNTAYVDVAAIPGFDRDPATRALVASTATTLAQLRAAPMVDTAGVVRAKRPVLDALWRLFRDGDLASGGPQADAFRRFCDAGGADLRRHALFDAMQAHFYGQDAGMWSWRRWPDGHRHPDGPGTTAFARDHADSVDFNLWLQWIADGQLRAAQDRAIAARMPIGLYVDLAVAEHPDGAAAWGRPDVVLAGVSVGAPPDLLSPLGQDWGLSPMSPVGLREAGYAPLVAGLRAAMRHAGAVRIDHVMSLTRLFCIPTGRPGSEGAYLRYPLEDLVRIVALESRRNGCLVVGEDLGTVPEGFRPRMRAAGVLSYRVLWFERDPAQAFLPPSAYPAEALVTVTTHDLPTLPGWWDGRDLAWRARLGFYADEAARLSEGHERFVDRFRLLDALTAAGLAPETSDRSAGPPPLTTELMAAVYRLLARSDGRILMVSLEDLAGETEQPNLPGTVDTHPNWRRRMPDDAATILDTALARAILTAVRSERG